MFKQTIKLRDHLSKHLNTIPVQIQLTQTVIVLLMLVRKVSKPFQYVVEKVHIKGYLLDKYASKQKEKEKSDQGTIRLFPGTRQHTC